MKVLVLATLLCATAAMAEPLPQPAASSGSCPLGYRSSPAAAALRTTGRKLRLREIW
jgi:hypothetical protein